jgi:hypothetical protein
MPQQDFDNFKLRLQEWKETHSEEYDLFEDEINSRDAIGYQKSMSYAITLVPAYQKIIKQKVNEGIFDDISDIENLFTENKLAQTLLNEFENPNKDSIIPAMLYWLYFGKSFERMVEKGEELRKAPNINYITKFFIKSTIRLLRNKSISLGLRTKADWEEHFRLMKEVDNNEVMDLDIDTETNKTLIKPKNSKELSLEEMIVADDEIKVFLLTRIRSHIELGAKGQKIAWMILALRQLGYLTEAIPDKHLFDAIREKFGLDIGSDKGIYAYLFKGTEKDNYDEIETMKNYFQLK